MVIDLRSATLRKGAGSALASATVRHGGVLRGSVIGSGIPVDHVDAFGAFGKLFDGNFSFVADIDGTLADFGSSIDLGVSRLRIGPQSLPPSHLRVAIERSGIPPKDNGKTRCENPRAGVFDQAEFDKDLSSGLFRVSGSMFDGQLELGDVQMTRQKRMVLKKGTIVAKDLDLGTLANLVPGVAFASTPPTGALSATLDVKDLPFDKPDRGELTLTLDRLALTREGELGAAQRPARGHRAARQRADRAQPARAAPHQGRAPRDLLHAGEDPPGPDAPDLDLSAQVEPIDLSKISAGIAGVEHAAGMVKADVRVLGPLKALRYTGSAELRKGELQLRGLPVPLSDINVDLEIAGGDVRIKSAKARVGGGTIEVGGRMPLRGADAGAASGNISARGVKVPIADGVDVTADADLELTYQPSSDPLGAQPARSQGERVAQLVPLHAPDRAEPEPEPARREPAHQRGDLRSGGTTPCASTSRSARRARCTSPTTSSTWMLEVATPGIVLSGTNQRFGARGQLLRIRPESKLQSAQQRVPGARGHGALRRPAPHRAQGRRARHRPSTGATPAAPPIRPTAGVAPRPGRARPPAPAGLWRITLHAHGDADNLKVDPRERSRAEPGGHRAALDHRYDARRDRSEPRPRRSARRWASRRSRR
jgi:translocation and assembly module TamB